MLFRAKEYRYCVNCIRSAMLENGEMLCIKKGIVSPEQHCGHFRYDPLKRVPVNPNQTAVVPEDSDFSL